MFSGIIEELGTVVAARDAGTTRRLSIEAPSFAGQLKPGDSIAVDGACLTATELEGDRFSVDVIGTTLSRTVAGGYRTGSRVNLERALSVGARLDGHLVQGHVDALGHLTSVRKDGEYWLLDFEVPEDVDALLVPHGSITINGVSLTVNAMPGPRKLQVGIIPFTWEHTNLSSLSPGDPVNLEGDLIGKFVARFMAVRDRNPDLDLKRLGEMGY
jgi:riboflavin synthase